MSNDIPLLRESSVLARRLFEAASQFGEHAHRRDQRINWSWRFASEFHEYEARLFKADPDAYLANRVACPPVLRDVFAQRLSAREVLMATLKVLSHLVFSTLGRLSRSYHSRGRWIYRKAYVDDIELVFPPDTAGALRAIYPFPISIARQWRYIRLLRGLGRPFVLDGNRYSLRDLANLLVRRDVASLARLERRGELRRARALVAQRPDLVELSDEFNPGSLSFARYLARAGVATVNVAHGVGKYFPVHAYQRFLTLTQRQVEYYFASIPCQYGRHVLNEDFGVAEHSVEARARDGGGSRSGRAIVILSQDFGDADTLIAKAEKDIAPIVAAVVADRPDVAAKFKPHPNCRNPVAPPGFQLVSSIDELGATPDPILLSMFSTTHIDPRFKGRKFLVRSDLIRPEIAFDDDGRIVDIHDLGRVLRAELES